MRELNKRQRKAIDKIMDKRIVRKTLDITPEEYEQIEVMNDHETLYQNIERYIIDKIMDGLYD